MNNRYNAIRSVGEECINEDELKGLIMNTSMKVRVYDGFEPSGRLNIANCLMKVHNTNILTQNGCEVIFWIADLYAQLNQKFGGDLKKIQLVGAYMIEVWKAVGLNLDNVHFVWASEEINKKAAEYWPLVMDISRRFNMVRILRCTQALGRKESDNLTLSQMLYPAMQCADIFLLNAHICQMGMDQRKVNMLAREYVALKDCHKLACRLPPIILSHHMLQGLKENQAKMSKSDPDSCIYMDDTEFDINRKIKRAYCPPPDHEDATKKNPVLDYFKYVVFPIQMNKGNTIIVNRKDTESLEYVIYLRLEEDYLNGKIHPEDLKNSLKRELNVLIEPVRNHFAEGKMKTLLTRVKNLQKP